MKKLFRFIKKKAVSVEKVEGSEFDDWFDKRVVLVREEEAVLVEKIRVRVSALVVELKKGVDVLRNVDLENKKESGRLKLIVAGSLDRYVDFIERLIRDLERLDGRGFEEFIENVNVLLFEFDKKSKIIYERTTILIGDEMAFIRKSIGSFFFDLKKLIGRNKYLVKKVEVFSKVGLELSAVVENKALILKAEGEVGEIVGEIKKLKKKAVGFREEIVKVRESEEYSARLKGLKDVRAGFKELKKEKLALRGLIDFKMLVGKFHGDSKKMNIVLNCRDDFGIEFFRDKGKKILDLLVEAGVDVSEIRANVLRVISRERELKEVDFGDDEVLRLKGEAEGSLLNIERLERDRDGLLVRIEGLKAGNLERITGVGKMFEGVGVLIME